jgi:heptose-I-phosphate ethanolaminephosphotransferase
MTHPILKGLLFALIPLVYYLLDMLNYAQAGKSGLLGFFVLTTLFYWHSLYPKKTWLAYAIAFATILIYGFMVFQAGLRDIFGVEQDSIIVIEALFNTNLSESTEFLQQYRFQLIKHLLLLLIFVVSYLWVTLRYLKHVQHQRRALWIGCVVFTLLTILVHFNPTARRANPLFFFPIYYQQWAGELEQTKQFSQSIAEHASQGLASMKTTDDQANTVVWVIGESDTRNNWGLYGYPRATTPLLSALKKELQVFDHVKAADGGTVGSITKMLTPATVQQPKLWKKKPDIITIAKQVGYKTFWLSNQASDERGVISIFANHADVTVLTNQGTSRGEGSLDEALFKPYEQALADPAPQKLIIVHIMGAHPAYNFRYPEHYAKFDGVTDDAVAKDLTGQGRAFYAITFRNQYDNAISYQDYVLAGLLTRLKATQPSRSSWLYIADHGQDVSHHDNFSGHNQKAAEQWEVPMLLWQIPQPQGAVISTPFQADTIDHALLGLMHIHGKYYDPSLDILSPPLAPKE